MMAFPYDGRGFSDGVLMHIALLTMTFHLPGCQSLKEKRGRLRGLKERFGKLSNLAVAESAYHDVWDRSQWAFISIGRERAQIDRAISGVETFVNEEMDVVVIDVEREWL